MTEEITISLEEYIKLQQQSIGFMIGMLIFVVLTLFVTIVLCCSLYDSLHKK